MPAEVAGSCPLSVEESQEPSKETNPKSEPDTKQAFQIISFFMISSINPRLRESLLKIGSMSP